MWRYVLVDSFPASSLKFGVNRHGIRWVNADLGLTSKTYKTVMRTQSDRQRAKFKEVVQPFVCAQYDFAIS